MAMSERDRKMVRYAAAAAPVLGAVAFWMYVHQPKVDQIGAQRQRIDSLGARVDSARRDLARGSVEALRQRAAEYERAVLLMRRLVPASGEVENLIDDVSSRAKARGVEISNWTPMGAEDGVPFQTQRYRYTVVGHYDQIGEFLSDVASLSRIMVPYDVTIAPVQSSGARTSQDTSGALLEGAFMLRTFVKAPAPADSAGGGE